MILAQTVKAVFQYELVDNLETAKLELVGNSSPLKGI